MPVTESTLLFSSVQSLSRVQLFVTLWTAACQASLSITNSQSLLKLMSIDYQFQFIVIHFLLSFNSLTCLMVCCLQFLANLSMYLHFIHQTFLNSKNVRVLHFQIVLSKDGRTFLLKANPEFKTLWDLPYRFSSESSPPPSLRLFHARPLGLCGLFHWTLCCRSVIAQAVPERHAGASALGLDNSPPGLYFFSPGLIGLLASEWYQVKEMIYQR